MLVSYSRSSGSQRGHNSAFPAIAPMSVRRLVAIGDWMRLTGMSPISFPRGSDQAISPTMPSAKPRAPAAAHVLPRTGRSSEVGRREMELTGPRRSDGGSWNAQRADTEARSARRRAEDRVSSTVNCSLQAGKSCRESVGCCAATGANESTALVAAPVRSGSARVRTSSVRRGPRRRQVARTYRAAPTLVTTYVMRRTRCAAAPRSRSPSR